MRTLTRIVAVLVLALAPVVLGGCPQAQGERCQIDDDCESGLKCVPSPTVKDLDICEPVTPSAPDAGVADAALADAAGASDVVVAPDAAPPAVDAATADL